MPVLRGTCVSIRAGACDLYTLARGFFVWCMQSLPALGNKKQISCVIPSGVATPRFKKSCLMERTRRWKESVCLWETLMMLHPQLLP